MYIALTNLGLVLLFCLVFAVCVYLLLVLRQALVTLRDIRQIIEAQDTAIQQSLSLLPQLLANLSNLSLSLRQSADIASATLDSWQHDAAGTIDSLKDGLETIIVYSKAIGEMMRCLRNHTM